MSYDAALTLGLVIITAVGFIFLYKMIDDGSDGPDHS